MAAKPAGAISESVLSNFKVLRRHFRVVPPFSILGDAVPPVRFLGISQFVLSIYSEKLYQIQARPVKELSVLQTDAASENGWLTMSIGQRRESVEGGVASSPSARQRAGR
jgi:hypothetical protein